jgi:hypothetical protein
MDWKKEPPPARVTPSTPIPAVPPAPEAPAPPPAPAAPLPPPEPLDPMLQPARFSKSARQGLGTKRALYHRVATTRQLIVAWKKSGRYLARADRRLTRLAEANDLVRQFTEIEELLEDFPPLLGEAGQPGYLVLALAKQPMVAPTFRNLSPSQREALSRDWNTALNLLIEHRDFLREELRSLRKKSILGRTRRAISAFFSEHAIPILMVAGTLALLLGVLSYYRFRG